MLATKGNITATILLWLLLATKLHSACEWDWINPTPTGVQLNAVAYSDSLDLRVAVGAFGQILNSADGINWSVVSSDIQLQIDDVVWDGAQFIAISANQSSLTSSDGISWLTHTIASSSSADEFTVTDIASNGTLTIAVGSGGKIFSSSDGVNWALQVSGETDELVDVIWTGSQFVALTSTGNTLTSSDGVAWTAQGNTTIAQNNAAIAWDGSQYVVVGGGTSEQIVTSPDAVTWTQRTVPSSQVYSDVIWSGSEFIATSSIATGFGAARSVDGIAWESIAANAIALNGIGWDGSRFIAVGDNGEITTSANGETNTWTSQSSSFVIGSSAFSDIVWDGSRFIAASGSRVYSSADGELWQDLGIANNAAIIDVVASSENAILVASTPVSGGAPVYSVTTDNGQTWTQTTTSIADPTRLQIRDIIWTGTQFVAVGKRFDNIGVARGEEYFASSADGVVWTETILDGANDIPSILNGEGGLSSITSNGSRLVAVGPPISSAEGTTGLIMISDDNGLTFEQALPDSADRNGSGFKDIEWDGSQFVFIEEDNLGSIKNIWTSTTANANSWTRNEVVLSDASELVEISIANSNNDLLILDAGSVNGQRAFTSSDGLSWGDGEIVPSQPASGFFSAIPIENVASNGTRNVGVFSTNILKTDCYAPNDIPQAELTSPIPNTIFDSNSQTFTWDHKGNTPDNWIVNVGTTLGASDIATSGLLAAGLSSVTINNLPTDGEILYVRLIKVEGGVEITQDDEQYTSQFIATALITSPVPGSTLTNNNQTFTWDTQDAEVDNWRVLIGTTQGGSDVFTSADLPALTTSLSVSNIPTDGSNLWVRLLGISGSDTLLQDDASYMTSAPITGQLLTPSPGSTLGEDTYTFTWNLTNFAAGDRPRIRIFDASGLLVDSATLDAGKTRFSFTTVFPFDPALGELDEDVRLVSSLPNDGRALTVRLERSDAVTNILATEDEETYFAFNAATAEITSPQANTTLVGQQFTVMWDAGQISPDNWQLLVGSSEGASDILDSGLLASSDSNFVVTNVPTDGRTVYVRLLSVTSGVQSIQDDITYLAESPQFPTITSPVNGSELSGLTQEFTWQSNGTSVTEWWLYIGSEEGENDIVDTGSLGSVTTYQANNLPVDGSTIYARLFYREGSNAWQSQDFSYISFDEPSPLAPAITTPVNNSQLAGASQTFVWQNNTTPVTDWWLYLGTREGANDIYDSGNIGSSTSVTVNNLPFDNSIIYARLYYRNGTGAWLSQDFIYTAVDADSPVITTPINSAALTNSSQTFNWQNNDTPVTNWWLYLGTDVGGNNIYDSGVLDAATTNVLVNDLPTDESTIYARLFYRNGDGPWQSQDFNYTAFLADLPTITTPVNGSQLADTTQTFTWQTNGYTVSEWWLYLGSSEGANDLYNSGNLGADLSVTINDLPDDESTIYATLYFRNGSSGEWLSQQFSYTAYDEPLPFIFAPLPGVGSTLAGETQLFEWSDQGAAVTDWWLYLGTDVGGNDIYDSGILDVATTSLSVGNLPTDGSMVYARLFYRNGNREWKQVDFEYISANLPPPAINAPINGSQLQSVTQNFEWQANGITVTEWWLYVGSSLGARDIVDSGSLGGATSLVVNNLPADGSPIFARLYYRNAGGLWSSRDFNYTASGP